MPLSWNLGTLTSWNPLGHSRSVTGLLHLYLLNRLFPSRFPIKNPFKITFTPMHATFLTNIATVLPNPSICQAVQIMKLHIMHPFPLVSCIQFKHYSHHSVPKQKQLICGTKHSPILKALFYVFHTRHFLTIHILSNKMDSLKSNKTDDKPCFILDTNYCKFQHQGANFTGFIKGP